LFIASKLLDKTDKSGNPHPYYLVFGKGNYDEDIENEVENYKRMIRIS